MVIALLGLGNVGLPVYKQIKERYNNVIIKYVLVRNKENKPVNEDILVTDYNVILEDDEVECIIEMMGAHASYEYMKRALNAQKHVITANKEVIANHYTELKEIALSKGVELFFEASVGGGIPIINTLLNSPYNRINKIEGILNGTTNFILTSMHKEKIEFSTALAIAQERGFAEADPTNDLEGLDMVRKISILSMIAYSSKIDLNGIYHKGIEGVNKNIIEFIDLLGYRLKLMASSSLNEDNTISISVEPTLVKEGSILASVDYEYNIIRYSGDVSGVEMMYGKGAGSKTSNSILFDLNILLSKGHNSFIPANNFCCKGNNDTIFKYLLKINGKIDKNIVEKQLGEMVITKPISGNTLKMLGENVSFSARFLE